MGNTKEGKQEGIEGGATGYVVAAKPEATSGQWCSTKLTGRHLPTDSFARLMRKRRRVAARRKGEKRRELWQQRVQARRWKVDVFV